MLGSKPATSAIPIRKLMVPPSRSMIATAGTVAFMSSTVHIYFISLLGLTFFLLLLQSLCENQYFCINVSHHKFVVIFSNFWPEQFNLERMNVQGMRVFVVLYILCRNEM